MGFKETRRITKHACTGRLVIVALSAQPPGVNELCVCSTTLFLSVLGYCMSLVVGCNHRERMIGWPRKMCSRV